MAPRAKIGPKSQIISRWEGEQIVCCGHQEGRDGDDPDAQIVFYGAFVREPRSKGNNKGTRSLRSATAQTTKFSRGDTVLVQKGDRQSIGVIAQLWEVRSILTGSGDVARMRVVIHWFSKPSELPEFRPYREALKNEIYYTVDSHSEHGIDDIISSCKVLGRGHPEADKELNGTFVCKYGLDASTNTYFDFDLDEHVEMAMSQDIFDATSWDLDIDSFTARECHSPRKSASPTKLSDSQPRPTSPTKQPRPKTPTPRSNKKRRASPSPSIRYPSPEAAKTAEDSSVPPSDAETGDEADQEDLDQQDESDRDSETGSESGDEFQMSDSGEETDRDSNTTPELDSDNGMETDDDAPLPPSPKKRGRPASQFQTPRKKQRTIAFPTPHSKARLKKKRSLHIRPLSQLPSEESRLPDAPRDRLLHVLHVGARPNALPCRETEYEDVLGAVLSLLEDNSGGCVYISGVPGTGKTATVYAAVRELKEMARRAESNPFTYVEINGLRLAEAHAAYRVLWEAVSNHDVVNEGHLNISNKESLGNLTKHFSKRATSGEKSHACVVLMDELDQLMTAKQDVVYNFFNWPNMQGSRLIIIAVANTHDLPERAMNGRVRSRLGMTRINFRPYSSDQLEEIVKKRLESAAEGVDMPEFITGDAIKFASKKVASISGDARRVLDICRRATEKVAITNGKVVKAAGIPDVKKVIDAMQNSPTAGYLRECSLHERILLAALLKCSRKSGVEDIKWSEVLNQHYNYCMLLTGNESTRKPSPAEMELVLTSLVSSKAVLVEEGAIASRKDTGDKKVALAVEQTEVERVLGDMGGERWKSVLGAS